MNSSFFKTSSFSIYFIFILIISICVIIIPIYQVYPQAFLNFSDKLILDSDSEYFWPIPRIYGT